MVAASLRGLIAVPIVALWSSVCLITATPAVALATPCISPCDVCWKGPTDGSWDKDSNWNSGRVPLEGEHVCIIRDGTYTVTLTGGDATIGRLTIGGDSGTAELRVEGLVLRLEDGDLEIRPTGKLTLVDGAVGPAGETTASPPVVINDGVIWLDGGEVAMPLVHGGELEWRSTGNLISGALTTRAGCSMSPRAAAKSRPAGDPAVALAARSKATPVNQLTISQGFTSQCHIELDEIGDLLSVSSGPLVNYATGSIATGGVCPEKELPLDAFAVLDAEIDNFGSIDVNGTPLFIRADGGDSTNRDGGTITVGCTDLTFDLGDAGGSMLTNSGSIVVGGADVAAAPVLTILGGVYRDLGGMIVGSGLVRLSDTEIEGNLGVDQGNLEVELAGVTTGADTTVTNRSSTFVVGTADIGGSLINTEGGSLVIRGSADRGDAELRVGGSVENSGTIRLENIDTIERNVTFQVAEGLLLNTQSGSIVIAAADGEQRRIAADLTNRGSLVVEGDGSAVVAGGALDNDLRGTIEIRSGELSIQSAVDGVAGKAGARFANSGKITLGGGTRMKITSVANPSGGGKAGTKAIAGFDNYGSIITGAGSEFVVGGMEFINQPGGRMEGEGAFDFTAATGVESRGVVSPGDFPSQLTVRGGFSHHESASLVIDVGRVGGEFRSDRMVVEGPLDLGGSLDIGLVGASLPTEGTAFTIVEYQSLSGGFDSLSAPPLDGGLGWTVTAHDTYMLLETICSGPELVLAVQPDKNPVSLGYEVRYLISLSNDATGGASEVVVTDVLPANLIFVPESSSPQCQLSGGDVRCEIGDLGGLATVELVVAAEPLDPGLVANPFEADHFECVSDASGYSASATVRVTSAQPCDADADGEIRRADVAASVAHIWGIEAAGNPDCRVGGGVTADDLAKLVHRVALPARYRRGPDREVSER